DRGPAGWDAAGDRAGRGAGGGAGPAAVAGPAGWPVPAAGGRGAAGGGGGPGAGGGGGGGGAGGGAAAGGGGGAGVAGGGGAGWQGRVCRAVSVFAGPFALEGAEAVAGPDAGLAVLRLVDCSLLAAPGEGPDGRARYLMLETLRAFGADRLAEAGERDAAAAA